MTHVCDTPAKLTMPVPARVYDRVRLYRRLDELRDHPVVWIAAPAGAGKTTLVAAYLRAREIRPLWYRLDCGDGDAGSFFHYLGEGLMQLNGARERTLPVLAPEHRGALAAFSRRFFRTLFASMEAPGVVVLDNLEAAGETEVLDEILHHGLEEIPPGRQVIVTSRTPPPPSQARALAEGRLARMDWPELQLTHDEGRGLIRHLAGDRPPPAESAARMQERAGGWVTGLLLQLQQTEAAPTTTAAGREFSAYFASELFSRLPLPVRALLLRTAWLDPVHPDTAEHLTGIHDTGRWLEWLAHQQLFVTRLAGTRPAYAYHPLLREFLLERARAELPEKQQHALKRRAARHLEEAGEADEAARLYRETEHWEALANLALKKAPELLEQGRHHRLRDWLTALPDTLLEQNPWLLFWLGAALLAFDARLAGNLFRSALGHFVEKNEATGAYLAWQGVMDSLMYANDTLAETPRWLDELERLRARFGPCDDPELEGRIAFTAFNMGFTACPGSRPPHEWAETAERLRSRLPAIADDTTRCLAASHLAMYFTWHPQPARLKLLADALLPYAGSERIAPLARVIAYLVEITRRWVTGEAKNTTGLIDEALALVEEHGIAVGRLWLLSAAIIYHLTREERGRATELLARYRRHIQPGNRHEQVHFDYLAGWLAWLDRDLQLASEHTARAWTDIQPLHTPHFELLCGWARAFTLIETQRYDAAAHLIEELRKRARRHHSHSVECFQLGLLESWMAWRRGEMEQTVPRLRTALACGRELDLQVTLWHLPPVLARLCAIALEHDIETDYVRRFIRRNGLPRPPGTELLDRWPVAVRIHTLGRFVIECGEQPLDTASRSHRKPFKLLKVLIALGGREVPAERIEDILWPDSEGGDARRALITTLQRLRKALGARDLVRFEDGRLSLDPNQVWLDTWAMEAGLAAEDPSCCRQALRLYRGPFLNDEKEHAWLIAIRGRLHDGVLQCYERLGRTLVERGEWNAVVELYRRALRVDDLHEPFYRQLMQAHARLGRQTEAVRLYHRCHERLGSALGLPPSSTTRNLYEELTSQNGPG